MIANIATTSLVIAIFAGSCAFGVGKTLGRIMKPVTYGALAIAVVLYVVAYMQP